MTQIAAVLLLFSWWLASAQPASAMQAPPNDTDASSVPAPTTIVVHDHVTLQAYLLVAVIAVVATLAAITLARWTRRRQGGRQAARLQPA
jgi:hypothetical protein